MLSRFFPPYLTPAEDTVEMQPWLLLDRGESAPLVSPVADWASGTDLALSRGLIVDLVRLREQCRLAPDTSLGLVVSWRSDASKIQRCLLSRALDESRNEVQVTLPGRQIGGTVQVSTTIVLLANVETPAVGAPHLRGSVLVRDVVSVTLEGEGSVFPMAVVDFTTRRYDDDASWFVETSTDPHANFSSAFQVMINERDGALIKAIEAEKPTREQQALIDELESGVMQVVLELAYALKAGGELSTDQYGDGSVGQVLQGLIEQTGDLALGDISDASRIAQRQSQFQALARRIAAGRGF